MKLNNMYFKQYVQPLDKLIEEVEKKFKCSDKKWNKSMALIIQRDQIEYTQYLERKIYEIIH